jgi:hypothetical protein
VSASQRVKFPGTNNGIKGPRSIYLIDGMSEGRAQTGDKSDGHRLVAFDGFS